ncbi:SUKH-3 domain-containing protein [Enterococcus sp. LJL51]|uniref:SUKH-3 domain-containing protein n=1 Tax=Enterococcus sp. LJL51 TaxID=3416656 RepID=UPI003CF5D85F
MKYTKKLIEEIILKSKEELDNSTSNSELVVNLNKLGYQINTIQQNFLIEFEGFTIDFESLYDKKDRRSLSIRTQKFAREYDINLVRDYEKHLGKKLLIVGEIPQEPTDVFIAEDGSFYGCNDSFVVDYEANSFNELLFKVMNCVRITPEILEDE